MVVVAAGLVDANENNASNTPSHVLFVQLVSGIAALALEGDRPLTKAQGGCDREEYAPQISKSLDRTVAAIIRAVAVSPLVVAGQIDEPVPVRVKQRKI